MQLPALSPRRLAGAAAIGCAAALTPAAALAAAASPAAGTATARPVTGYVASFAGVTRINTITNALAAGLMRSAGPGVAAVPTGFRPASASFQSPASGFVLGGVGCKVQRPCAARLVATTDGGARWHFVQAPAVRLAGLASGGSVRGVVFASRRAGWLYGPALWSTRDGGAHWRELALGGAVTQVAASAGRVYAVVAPPGGKPGELFASPAGRDAWARVGHVTARFAILAVSGRAAWFGNGGGFIERSSPYVWATPDGAHWHKYPVRCPAPYDRDGLASIAAASPSDVSFLCLSDAAAGQQGKALLRSVNGGKTTRLAGTAPTSGPGGVIALPPRRPQVITLGTAYFLDRSGDGGKTWTTNYRNTGGAPWNSLSYLSPTAGWAEFGSPPDSGLLQTTDAGVTWGQVRFAGPARPVTAYVASFAGVTPAGSASRATAHPQQRQLAVTMLSRLQGGADSHPVTRHRAGPGGHRHRGRLPAYATRLEADRGETNRQGQRVVLVRDGSLQPHGDPAQPRAQLRGAIRHDHGAPAVGPGDRLPGTLHRALATVTAIVYRAGDITVAPA